VLVASDGRVYEGVKSGLGCRSLLIRLEDAYIELCTLQGV
jgi:hypothetical protein